MIELVKTLAAEMRFEQRLRVAFMNRCHPRIPAFVTVCRDGDDIAVYLDVTVRANEGDEKASRTPFDDMPWVQNLTARFTVRSDEAGETAVELARRIEQRFADALGSCFKVVGLAEVSA